MEDITLLNLWKSYESKLEDNLQLNRRNALDLTQIKLRSLLSSMRPIKVFTIVAGILWVALVDMIIVDSFQTASLYFLISAIAQVLLTKWPSASICINSYSSVEYPFIPPCCKLRLSWPDCNPVQCLSPGYYYYNSRSGRPFTGTRVCGRMEM